MISINFGFHWAIDVTLSTIALPPYDRKRSQEVSPLAVLGPPSNLLLSSPFVYVSMCLCLDRS
jgi:hypothetical protein